VQISRPLAGRGTSRIENAGSATFVLVMSTAIVTGSDPLVAALFTAGLAVIRYAKIYGTKHRPWLAALLARRPTKVAAPTALAA
jgi:hypothetical protein